MLVIRRGGRARLPGYWAPLSGTIEAGESQEQALVREIREEVGLDATPLAKVWESISSDGGFVLHWWEAAAGPGAPVLAPGEVSEARWVTVEEFLRLEPIFDGDRAFFERALATTDAPADTPAGPLKR
ncbi:NUDIX hydrolase [Nonomuraea longicatena]|uniref:Nudix hydrolase domain-containing protein n=1 Tax=Nonomuraea longicatena TaxID=83682 RepID=A0ABN1PV84_9ACTN